MDGVGFAFVVIVFVVLGIGGSVASKSTDKDRIRVYIEERGGRLVSVSWAPFGQGWFGEKNSRIYEVVYYDREGNQHWATCKTSLFSGVYWTEDRVSHRKADWYDGLPPRNAPGDPVIRHLSEHSAERVERIAAEALGLSAPGEMSVDPLDDEIARLKIRLADLERQKRTRTAE